MRKSFLVLACLLSGCMRTNLHGVPAHALGDEFAISIGQTVVVGDRWHIQFSGVPEDSRCPMNARCIWEGNARVSLKITGPGPDQLELNTSERFEKAKALTGAVVTLVHLEPSRMAGAPTRDYVATLVVKAAP